MSKALTAFPFGLAFLYSASGCAPEVPAAPSYAKDVQPIFMARCTRCHGETLRGDLVYPSGPPAACHLNRYESMGDCTTNPLDPTMCSLGAGLCVAALPTDFFRNQTLPTMANSFKPPMPLDPAPKLDDWEQKVITAWLDKVDANGMPAP